MQRCITLHINPLVSPEGKHIAYSTTLKKKKKMFPAMYLSSKTKMNSLDNGNIFAEIKNNNIPIYVMV